MKADLSKIGESAAANVIGGMAVLVIGAALGQLTGSFAIIGEFASEHPVETAVVCLAVFLMGLAIGWVVGRVPRLLGDRRKREARLASSERVFREEPSGEKKAMAAAVYRWQGHAAAVNGAGATEVKDLENAASMPSWTDFFVVDAKGADWYYIRLEDWLLELFDERPGILDEFPETALAEADDVLSRFEPW